MADAQSDAVPPEAQGEGRRGRIVRRYFLIFATLVGGALIVSALAEMAFRFQETRRNLEIVHRQMAEIAALRIRDYIEDVAHALRLAAAPRRMEGNRIADEYVMELRNLIRSVPSIRDVFAMGLDGREQFRVSRIGPSIANTQVDHTKDAFFSAARAGETYFGPVIFPADSFEPRIMIAVPIEPFRGEVVGVLAAEVNVRYVWDVVQAIRIGDSGYAYVVSAAGVLVAHPDLHLVLQRKDMSELPQVAALRNPDRATAGVGVHKNLAGQYVLAAHELISNVRWTVLVERPLTEAYAPLLGSLARTGGILLVVCVVAIGAAMRLGRRVVEPIEELRRGAARLGAGELDARLNLKTGDEFEELADDFNRMAARLQDAHAGLEQKVTERTQALEQSLGEVRALGETIRAVSASLDLQNVLRTLILHATELSRSDGGVIYEFDEAAQVFRFRASNLLQSKLIDLLRENPPTLRDSIIGRAAVTAVPENIPDIASDATSPLKAALLAENYRSILAVPMIRGERLIGGLVLGRKRPGGFSESEIHLVRTFAGGCTIAIEHARLFLEVAQKNTALQKASQHKSQFLANMSHELRTPMNAILGFTDLLLDGVYGDLSDRVRIPIEQIHTNGQHLLRLINDVLDLSKIEAGRIDLSLDEYAVDEILEALQTTTRPLARAKNLGLNFSTNGKTGHCYGDGRRVYQVLLNLVGNAIKFTRHGQVDVGVMGRDDDIHYTVKDTGIGIPPDELNSIFDEFGRGDPAVAKEFSGTGLGLAIAKRFVTMHGGRIWAESKPHAGSTFHVVVPRRVAETGESQA
jgi:signal transduction histidine kinase/HAMP domain-containing protein